MFIPKILFKKGGTKPVFRVGDTCLEESKEREQVILIITEVRE